MEKFQTFDGLKLAYSDEGFGLPVLCLAGLTRSSTDFDYVAPHLPGIRLIRMDYRGRGQSDWAQDPASYAIPVEAQDALGLLDHLGLEKAAILGTSRGGIIAMTLAAIAKARLIGVCLNDIGPELAQTGLDVITDYIGRRPSFAMRADMAAAMPRLMPGFANVSPARWHEEVERHTIEKPDGLHLTYDPKLRDAVLAMANSPSVDLWPFFDAFDGLPLALIRGANSNLLTAETAQKMQTRRPDMTFATVPDRAHIPFLDEPEALNAINAWLENCK